MGGGGAHFPSRVITRACCLSSQSPVLLEQGQGSLQLNFQHLSTTYSPWNPEFPREVVGGRCLWAVGGGRYCCLTLLRLFPLPSHTPAAVTRLPCTFRTSSPTGETIMAKFKVTKAWASPLPKIGTYIFLLVSSLHACFIFKKLMCFSFLPKPAIRWLASHSLSTCLAFCTYGASFTLRNNLILHSQTYRLGSGEL